MGPQKGGQAAKKKFNKRMAKLNKDGTVHRAPGKSRGRNWQRKTASEAALKQIASAVSEKHHQAKKRETREQQLKDQQNASKRAKTVPLKKAHNLEVDEAPQLVPITWKGELLEPLQKRFYLDPEEAPSPESVLRSRQILGVKVQQNIHLCPPPAITASDPGLTEHFAEYMKNARFPRPTPIQSQLWTAILSGRDVIGIAPTGSGKTLSYLLPAVVHAQAQEDKEELREGQGPIVLVIVPTRELAGQVRRMCKTIFSIWGIRSLELLGGQKRDEQLEKLNSGSFAIISATPGRLVDLVTSGDVPLDRVTYVVLDECDNLLKLGFDLQLKDLMTRIRPDRQTIMCSATFKGPVQEAAALWMSQPVIKVRVVPPKEFPEGGKVESASPLLTVSRDVTQVVRVCEPQDTFDKLADFITMLYKDQKKKGDRNLAKVLVFVNRKDAVMGLAKLLRPVAKQYGAQVVGMSGLLRQDERKECMQAFRSGKASVMVSTDLLGRGTDMKMLDYVINFEFPATLEQYVHRVGRTGRQGRKGYGLSFISPDRKDIAVELVQLLRSGEQRVDPQLIKMMKHERKRRRSEQQGKNNEGSARSKEAEKRESQDELDAVKNRALEFMQQLAQSSAQEGQVAVDSDDDRWGNDNDDDGDVKGNGRFKGKGKGRGRGFKGKGKGKN